MSEVDDIYSKSLPWENFPKWTKADLKPYLPYWSSSNPNNVEIPSCINQTWWYFFKKIFNFFNVK